MVYPSHVIEYIALDRLRERERETLLLSQAVIMISSLEVRGVGQPVLLSGKRE